EVPARRVALLVPRGPVGRWNAGSGGDAADACAGPVGRVQRADCRGEVRSLPDVTYQFLAVRRDGPVEYLTLNRPEVRNAFNDHVIAELTAWAAAVLDAAERHDVRVVVLAGAGKTFCAGADVAWMSKTIAYTREENL